MRKYKNILYFHLFLSKVKYCRAKLKIRNKRRKLPTADDVRRDVCIYVYRTTTNERAKSISGDDGGHNAIVSSRLNSEEGLRPQSNVRQTASCLKALAPEIYFTRLKKIFESQSRHTGFVLEASFVRVLQTWSLLNKTANNIRTETDKTS